MRIRKFDMRVEKFAATALLAIAATTIASGTVHAAPAAQPTESIHQPVLLRGDDHGVTFTSQLTADSGAVTTVLDTGTFALSATGDAIAVSDAQGRGIATVPLTYRAHGLDIALRPTIEKAGKELTLRPASVAPEAVREVALRDIGTAEERWNAELQRASFGALIGGAIGLLISLPIFGLLFFPVVLAAIAVGAGIGLLAAGGQPLIDAGIAHFGGQPEPPTQPAP
ncbi:hypothetical protein [Nocardia sp. NPDC050406]|uniref:hypothetical protein n=1 Tax=Nocardia sp. NPDC050406 TaxID=3364318 RepID=UPI0037A7F9BF